MRLADEVWLGLALLHEENPERGSFSAGEILDRLEREAVTSKPRRKRKSVSYRTFSKLPDGTYRLYWSTDAARPGRKRRTMPERDEFPSKYRHLLDWYRQEYFARDTAPKEEDDPILGLVGLGKEIWAGTNADDMFANYVRTGMESRTMRTRISESHVRQTPL